MNNFTNNRWISVIILLILTANIVTLALLWSHHRGGDKREMNQPPPAGGEVFEFLTHELKLDSAQQAAYRKLRDEHQAGQRPLHDSIRKAKDDFFALLQQSGVTDDMMRSSSKKIGDMEQQQNIFTFQHFQKLRALCNPDQQKKFDTIIQDILKHMGPRQQGPPRPREGDRPDRGRMPPPPHDPNEEGPPPQK